MYYYYMNINIILSLVIASFFLALSDIFRNKSVPISGPIGTLISTEIILVVLLLTLLIILHFYNNKLGPLYIPKISDIFTSFKFNFFSSLGLFLGLILINISFYYNSKLKEPVNIGILTTVLSLSFIFTFIIDILDNLIEKKPIIVYKSELIGCLFIILGILIIGNIKKE